MFELLGSTKWHRSDSDTGCHSEPDSTHPRISDIPSSAPFRYARGRARNMELDENDCQATQSPQNLNTLSAEPKPVRAVAERHQLSGTAVTMNRVTDVTACMVASQPDREPWKVCYERWRRCERGGQGVGEEIVGPEGR